MLLVSSDALDRWRFPPRSEVGKRMSSNLLLVNPRYLSVRALTFSESCENTSGRGVVVEMKVLLGPLAKSALENRVGPNLPVAINAALDYYVGRLDNDHGPAPVPDFLVAQGSQFEVRVDERIEASLVADAEGQGVPVPELAGHAVLVYLAEITPARHRAA
jgi:hypothetical protein